MNQNLNPVRGGELGVLRVREHPLSAQVHPLTAKSTLSKLKKNFVKYLVILRSNKKYDYLRLNLGKQLKRTTIIRRYALNLTITSRKAPPGVSTIFHP